ncbi:MAG: hypothetical protein HOD85_14400 [Deltaproteobacteria bacterium]|nr:hypothetical protein [Deltaproteobacteria bacterium]
MKTGTQADLRRYLLNEHGVTVTAPAISRLVKTGNYRIQLTLGGKIKLEETAKALVDSGFPASNNKGKDYYQESEPVKKKKKGNIEIDIEIPDISPEEKPAYKRFLCKWMAHDWKGYSVGIQTILDTLEFELWDFEQDRYTDLDALSVITETMCDYFRAVNDFKQGKKYTQDTLAADNDSEAIESKSDAIEYCRKLIDQLETDIEKLKNGTYYPD